MRAHGNESFLLYSNAKLGQVKGISLDPAQPQEVIPPISDLLRPVAVDYDIMHGYVHQAPSRVCERGRERERERESETD